MGVAQNWCFFWWTQPRILMHDLPVLVALFQETFRNNCALVLEFSCHEMLMSISAVCLLEMMIPIHKL